MTVAELRNKLALAPSDAEVVTSDFLKLQRVGVFPNVGTLNAPLSTVVVLSDQTADGAVERL